ncbi:GNAT family N-acetyltransferase [Rarobacter incanus]|uniref:N-acetyltransferase domain-containing protein n=1 Tax=Rarobacter incanus TaxID=153494 RepID=A0A542SN98_9MICO|nr:GNAT family N-acetyltransferase [Rarobacter incanus]TQK76048.1 hypothetical protein FB389_0703 [Rarobacter incanus]
MTDPHGIERLHARADFDDIYERVLVPSFPAHELEQPESLWQQIAAGGLHAFAARGAGGRFDSVVMVADHAPVALVLYLAIDPTGRGSGTGSRLIRFATDFAARDLRADYVLAEVESPARHGPHPTYGDPRARLRFYARQGMRLLDAPYFQPGIGPGAPRVPALLLGLLAAKDAVRTDAGVLAPPLAAFMRSYLVASEGRLGDDGATVRLLAALDRPVVRTLPANDYREVAHGDLVGEAETHAPAP